MDQDWRTLAGRAYAWFDAPSMAAGAALVRRTAGRADADLRPGGVRVHAARPDPGISAAAAELGLTAAPAALQAVRLVIDTADRPSLAAFWPTVLGYGATGAETFEDPSRRDPPLTLRPDTRPDTRRDPRDRIHVDVVRPSGAVAAVRAAVAQEPSGPYGVALADADGNVVDLVPGDPLPGATDWHTLFSAMAFYPVGSAATAGAFVAAVAALADDAGLPLLVDVRAAGVTVDSGKDRWEDSGADFAALAGRIQSAAHDLGLVADPAPLRFVQVGIDAVDVAVVRAFWASVLGYEYDPREFVTDICDPRRLNPVVFFQPTDAGRPEHRNRVHLELVVPSGQVQVRVDAAVKAGGRVAADGHTLIDPEGNELQLIPG